MATGMSIHVGVNDTKAAGVSAPLHGCDQDARDMFALARNRGFVGVGDGDVDEPILGDKATRDAVLTKILFAAGKLEAGDIFLFTFSGHGTRRGEEDDDEVDDNDETLVMQDKFLVDNVLRKLVWPSFKAGVRVVMVSDSCHSGGVAMSSLVRDSEGGNGGSSAVRTLRAMDFSEVAVVETHAVRSRPQSGFRIRTISESENKTHFELLKEFYAKVRSDLPQVAPPITANVLLLAACREHETTKDGDPNGVFTRELLKAFNANGPKKYTELMTEISVNLHAAGEGSTPVLKAIPSDTPTFSDTEAFRI